jgi:arylsulfatase A-like enzyme
MSLSTFYKMAIGMLMLQFVNCFCLFAQNKRPNIIFILTDDQRWDALGFAGNSIIQTPQIDSLALSGKYFKNAFSSTPICAASRASILSVHMRILFRNQGLKIPMCN